jgi:NAD(P)-dependent dehydrogenase (short-subunit alcohol dehydrogenase family)
MKGKTVLITGATSGIGKETARALAKLGATIVFTTRDDKRGKAALAELIKSTGNNNIDVLFCDLASFSSVRKCCEEFRTKYDKLHVLINNAGVWDSKRKLSADGIENIFATNYLAPFLMTELLLDNLKKNSPSRIINLSSGLLTRTIYFDDIEFKTGFSGKKAYSQSKLAILLYTRLLATKLKGTGVSVNSVQPGMVATNLGRDAGRFSQAIFRFLGKAPVEGAKTPIYLASSPDVANITGECFAKQRVKKTSKVSYDMVMAEKLWALSEGYVRRV